MSESIQTQSLSSTTDPFTPSRQMAEQLEARIERSLRERGYANHAEIHCCAHEGVVILQGSALSYHVKQIVFAIATRDCEIVLIDRIRIQRHESP